MFFIRPAKLGYFFPISYKNKRRHEFYAKRVWNSLSNKKKKKEHVLFFLFVGK